MPFQMHVFAPKSWFRCIMIALWPRDGWRCTHTTEKPTEDDTPPEETEGQWLPRAHEATSSCLCLEQKKPLAKLGMGGKGTPSRVSTSRQNTGPLGKHLISTHYVLRGCRDCRK